MKRLKLGCAALCALSIAGPAWSHHSVAMFDHAKEIKLQGVVKQLHWASPHAWIDLVVTPPGGPPEQWAIEGSSPLVLERYGWSHDTFKPGDVVTLTANPLKDGRLGGSFLSATFAEGHGVEGRPGGR